MFVAVVLLLVTQSTAPQPAVDPSTLGPRTGEKAPAFTATDQDGRERTLESLMGPKGLLLVFFRSADW